MWAFVAPVITVLLNRKKGAQVEAVIIAAMSGMNILPGVDPGRNEGDAVTATCMYMSVSRDVRYL